MAADVGVGKRPGAFELLPPSCVAGEQLLQLGEGEGGERVGVQLPPGVGVGTGEDGGEGGGRDVRFRLGGDGGDQLHRTAFQLVWRCARVGHPLVWAVAGDRWRWLGGCEP